MTLWTMTLPDLNWIYLHSDKLLHLIFQTNNSFETVGLNGRPESRPRIIKLINSMTIFHKIPCCFSFHINFVSKLTTKKKSIKWRRQKIKISSNSKKLFASASAKHKKKLIRATSLKLFFSFIFLYCSYKYTLKLCIQQHIYIIAYLLTYGWI